MAPARWIDWLNHRGLYKYCRDVAPVELEAAYHAQRRRPAAGRGLRSESLRIHRAVQMTIIWLRSNYANVYYLRLVEIRSIYG